MFPRLSNGFRVYASDLRGHGLSVPQSELGKANVQFWADTTADMKQLLDLIHKENPELPRFAFGHSLGSGLTQSHIQNWGSMFKGAILCGTFGAFPGMNASQLHNTAGALQPLAFSAETSDKTSAVQSCDRTLQDAVHIRLQNGFPFSGSRRNRSIST